MDVSEIMKQAWAAVEKANLPKEIQVSAFTIAVQLLTSTTEQSKPSIERVSSKPPAKKTTTKSTRTVRGTNLKAKKFPEPLIVSVTEEEMYELVMQHTHVDKLKLEKLVQLDDGEVKLNLSSIKGNLTTAGYTRSIATVLAIVRNAGLGEIATPVSAVKIECERLKKFDVKHFAEHISSIENFSIVGSGKSRSLKPRTPAFATLTSNIDALLGVKPTL